MARPPRFLSRLRTRFRKEIAGALIAAFALLPAFASARAATVPQQYAPKAAPPFVFEDRGGAQHALSDYHGHYVLLNFWATWCSPCVHELPSLDALQARFGSRLTILPVSENSDGDGLAAFYRAHGIAHLQIARDPADIAPQLFHLSGVPTTILIDPQGRETARIKGGTNWTSPAMTAFLTAWMKNP